MIHHYALNTAAKVTLLIQSPSCYSSNPNSPNSRVKPEVLSQVLHDLFHPLPNVQHLFHILSLTPILFAQSSLPRLVSLVFQKITDTFLPHGLWTSSTPCLVLLLDHPQSFTLLTPLMLDLDIVIYLASGMIHGNFKHTFMVWHASWTLVIYHEITCPSWLLVSMEKEEM